MTTAFMELRTQPAPGALRHAAAGPDQAFGPATNSSPCCSRFPTSSCSARCS